MTHFTFSKTNLKKYSIVYPRFNMSYLVTLELEKLKKAIKAITGKEPKLYPDDGKEHIYEIVVANAKRDDARGSAGWRRLCNSACRVQAVCVGRKAPFVSSCRGKAHFSHHQKAEQT